MKKRFVNLALAFTFLVAMLGIVPAQVTSAATFNANRVMDDSVFDRVGSMSASQIDAFLNARNSCISPNSGFSAPDPIGYSPSGGYQYGGNVSAGTVILHAAQAYDLNPQVLIATLQKEQSLITSTTCSTNTISKAVGYGCPDSYNSYSYTGLNLYTRNGTTYSAVDGICVNSALKAGFSQQIIRAAWLFKFSQQRAKGNIGWAIIRGNWNNSDDLQSCYSGPMTQGTWKTCPNGQAQYFDGYRTIDGTAVHIDTGATAALYWYTPHFHGNQNFVNIFTGWFGSVYGNNSNINWNFEQLDGGGSTLSGATATPVGNYPFTLDVNGSLHNFYYDINNGNLKHSWTDTNGWNFEVVDGAGGSNGKIDADVGGMSKAVLLNGQMYVAYRDFSNHALRLATKVGGTWQAQTIDGTGGGGSRYNHDVAWDITMITNGNGLHLFYSDATWGNLRHAWSDDTVNWRHENLDGDFGSIARYDGNTGQGVKAAFLGTDIHVFYYEGARGDLRHAWADRTGWHFENLDGSPSGVSGYGGNVGMSPDFAVWQGTIQAYYFDPARGTLRHAWLDRNGWHFEDLDGNVTSISRYVANVGRRVTVVPMGSTLNVFYHDATHRAIRQAYANASGWHFANIDGTPDAVSGSPLPVGEHLSVTPFNNGETQLFFFDAERGALRHGWGR